MNIASELKSRQAALVKILEEKGIDAALIAGNSNVGPLSNGCFRYFTDWRCYYHLQAIVMRPGMEPAICVGSILHLQGLQEREFTDIRLGADILGSVRKILAEKPPKKLGIVLDMLPSDWYLAIMKDYPDIELVDITADIYQLRSNLSPEEVARIRKCATIADAGYEAVCRVARPGVRMMDLHAELDYAMMNAGAEEVFTLMSNGRFKYYNNGLPCIKGFGYPDDRVIQPGDNIGMEITPRYQGYWTQMVRTVCISEPNEDLIKAHKIQLDVIADTAKMLTPGTKLGDMLKHMWETGKSLGFIPKLPFGHIVGIDLDEGGRGSLESDFLLTKNANVVLHPTMCLGDMDYSIFWGDSFLVTENGGERINKCSTELQVL